MSFNRSVVCPPYRLIQIGVFAKPKYLIAQCARRDSHVTGQFPLVEYLKQNNLCTLCENQLCLVVRMFTFIAQADSLNFTDRQNLQLFVHR